MGNDDNEQQLVEKEEMSYWLGKETPPAGAGNEVPGITAILLALDEQEIHQIKELDSSYPIRYLRAHKGDVKNAVQAIRKTLVFRKEFGMDQLIPYPQDEKTLNNIIEDAKSNRIYVRGYDRQGRAFVVTQSHPVSLRGDEDTLKFCFWTLEKAIACTKKKSGLEKYVVVQNFDGFNNKYSWPFSFTRELVKISQHHYPERIHKIYGVDAPLAFRILWTLLTPFLDPDTRAKFVFCNSDDMTSLVATVEDTDKLEKFMGGETPVRDFDADEYMSLPFDVVFDEN